MVTTHAESIGDIGDIFPMNFQSLLKAEYHRPTQAQGGTPSHDGALMAEEGYWQGNLRYEPPTFVGVQVTSHPRFNKIFQIGGKAFSAQGAGSFAEQIAAVSNGNIVSATYKGNGFVELTLAGGKKTMLYFMG